MRINHNIAALNTYRQLDMNTTSGSKSLEKLSSGLRINRAGDDAAGLAISEKMRGQIRGLDQASRAVIILIVLFSTVLMSSTHVFAATDEGIVPKIAIWPDEPLAAGATVNVNLGEAVLFSAEATTYESEPSLLRTAGYSWNFGDGIELAYSATDKENRSGRTAVHYFMTPGEKTVTLTVELTNGGTNQTSIKVNVEGQKPLNGFEVLSAPFKSRLAQYITVVVPADVASAGNSNKLLVTLKGRTSEDSIEIYETVGLGTKETFLFDQRDLAADDYILTFELKDADGNVITVNDEEYGVWKEYFSYKKPYIGIDENNAICIDGTPTFITSPMNAKIENVPAVPITNAMYYSASRAATAGLWVNLAKAYNNAGYIAMGPGEGAYVKRTGDDKINANNTVIAEIENYTNAIKDDGYEFELIWDWNYCLKNLDEGMLIDIATPATIASWTYIAGKITPDYPTIASNYASYYAPVYPVTTDNRKIYDYEYSDIISGKKAFFSDIIRMRSMLPFTNYKKTELNAPKSETAGDMAVANWVSSIRNIIDRNENLVPVAVTLEAGSNVTHDQLLMEAWLAAVNGAKMVNWESVNLNNLTVEQQNAIAEFTTAVKNYGEILLGADVPDAEKISGGGTERGNRVDTLTRNGDDGTYLFAVRLTEPIGEAENETITKEFNVPGIGSGTVQVLDENKNQVGSSIPIEDGKFSASFAKNAYHIYRIVPAETSVTVGADNTSVFVGDTVTVEIGFETTDPRLVKVQTANIEIEYDSDVFQFVENVTVDEGLDVNNESTLEDDGNLEFVLQKEGAGAGITKDKKLLKLKFTAKAATSVNGSKISVKSAELSGHDNVNLDGVVQIIISDQEALGSETIAVNERIAVASVEIKDENNEDFAEASLEISDTIQLNAVVNPDNATNTAVSWSSTNDSVATVVNGLVTAIGPGQATITLTSDDDPDKTDTCVIEVVILPTGIVIKDGSNDVVDTIELVVEDTKTLTAVVDPDNASNKNVKWSTSDGSVATVDETTGLVTAIGPGNAIITATTVIGDITETCEVSVVAKQILVESLSFSETSINVRKGKTEVLIPTVTPEDATEELEWTSTDGSVATVDSKGNVTAVAVGSTTITVKVKDREEIFATVTVNVTEAPKAEDIDGDGDVDTADLYYVCYYYGKTESDTDWNKAQIADANGDKSVDYEDIDLVAKEILGIQ